MDVCGYADLIKGVATLLQALGTLGLLFFMVYLWFISGETRVK